MQWKVLLVSPFLWLGSTQQELVGGDQWVWWNHLRQCTSPGGKEVVVRKKISWMNFQTLFGLLPCRKSVVNKLMLLKSTRPTKQRWAIWLGNLPLSILLVSVLKSELQWARANSNIGKHLLVVITFSLTALPRKLLSTLECERSAQFLHCFIF